LAPPAFATLQKPLAKAGLFSDKACISGDIRPPSGVTFMRARIFQPARNAMQSGQAKTHIWVLEFDPIAARAVEPLMGWTSSQDMSSQVRMQFESQKAAEKYAADHGIDAAVIQPHKRKPLIRQGGYGENFATNRRSTWTH
jgi:ETC complex I subunit-like protein